MPSSLVQPHPTPRDGSANGFKMPRTKALQRPTTWFSSSSGSSSSSASTLHPVDTTTMRHTPLVSTSSGSSSSSNRSTASTISAASSGLSGSSVRGATTFSASPGNPFAPLSVSRGNKHRLSPSPSPNKAGGVIGQDEDFVMISPIRQNMHSHSHLSPHARFTSDDMAPSSSPIEDSPTPACGMASAAARLRLADEESPIRRVPGIGMSRSRAGSGAGGMLGGCPPSPLKLVNTHTNFHLYSQPMGSVGGGGDESPLLPETPFFMTDRPPPQPLFPLPRSHSQELKARTGGHTMFTPSKPVRADDSKIPRLSISHPLRARASTGSQMDNGERSTLGQKKAISLDRIPTALDRDEAFGSVAAPAAALGHARRTSKGQLGSAPRHRRMNSGDVAIQSSASASAQASISRSIGHKSGLALSLGGLPDFSYSNSSLSSLSTNNLTPPVSAFSPAEPPIFEDVKPLQEAFEQPSTALRKFKPRDSGVSMGGGGGEEDKLKIPPPSVLRPSAAGRPKRPAMLKRTSSMGDERERPLETPIEPTHASGWPSTAIAFDFLGESGMALMRRGAAAAAAAAGGGEGEEGGGNGNEKLSMPDTPVKRNHFSTAGGAGRRGMGHSSSQPSLGSSAVFDDPRTQGQGRGVSLGSGQGAGSAMMVRGGKMIPPGSVIKKKTGAATGEAGVRGMVPQLTLTGAGSSSPEMDKDCSSPSVRALHRGEGTKVGQGQGQNGDKPARVGLLRRLSNGGSGSEGEGTPTKGGGEKIVLASARSHPVDTPSKPPTIAAPIRAPLGQSSSTSNSSNGNANGTGSVIYPRLSLPAFANPKVHRTLHHRQSHPATKCLQEDENIFDSRFISLETLGKGAFSTVIKVQERDGEGLFAVKKARGVFDGVRDRLRHLEEVDILRHLSSPSNPHVLRFSDAWEQNRQLFIQTELCLGTLAFFLEEYGQVVERLDEARVWKIIRELSDGIHHIHSSGVIHFDLKPANILISDKGTLKIGDFGMASRYPRIPPGEILKGSGLGGSTAGMGGPGDGWMKIEREGDRVYMPPEMLQGVFGMAADIFSFGLVILEVSTNICVPDGGPAWHSLRTDDFSVVDLTPLSPALADLITSCMASDPAARPNSYHLVNHPVIVRARAGGAALAPEPIGWVAGVLAGYGFVPASASGMTTAMVQGQGHEGQDVEMMEA